MRRRRGRRGGVSDASIDMNSLIDLTFLLLVTFIITMPVLNQSIPVILPKGKAEAVPQKEPSVANVTVQHAPETEEGYRLYLDDAPVSLADLEARLKEKVAGDRDAAVLVHGDKRVDYGKVMDVVNVVYRSRVRRMSLVTREN